MPHKKFSLAKYEIKFPLIFNVPEVLDHFRIYLRKSLNEETLLFVVEVDKCKLQGRFTHEEATRINNLFVQSGSECEINVENSDREKVSQILLACETNHTEVPLTLFDRLYSTVYRELKEDAFSRYIRSEDFEVFAYKMGEEFIQRISIDLYRYNRNAWVLHVDDFYAKSINDKDICFAFNLCEDSADWIPIRRTKMSENEREQYTYVSKAQFLMGDSLRKGFSLAKFTGILPFSADLLFRGLCNNELRGVFDPNRKLYSLVEYIKAGQDNNNPYSCALIQIEIETIPILKNRGSFLLTTTVYDTSRQCYLYVAKTTKGFPERILPKKIIEEVSVVCFAFYKISETKCRYVHILYMDLDMNFTLFKFLVGMRGKVLHDGFVKLCQLMQENEEINDTAKIWQLYNDFCTTYLPEPTSEKTWIL